MDLRPAETVVLNFLSPINASKTERKIKLLISLLQSYDEAPTVYLECGAKSFILSTNCANAHYKDCDVEWPLK
ncbi:hypothetical protein T09_8772 [Trichinella sp. T9]|nr:hypothetical protein T09_8772 [Trichinella sp. T9]